MLSCDMCEFKIAVGHKIALRHVLQHNQKHRFKCKNCGKPFISRGNLHDHVSTYHENKKFKCSKCKSSFRYMKKLKQHVKKTHAEKKHKCKQCKAAFFAPYKLAEHVKAQHENLRWYCSVPGCSQKTLQRTSAADHLRHAHSLNGDRYEMYKSALIMK